MAAPLPTVGGSNNVWGTVLNAYLTELEARVTVAEALPSEAILITDNSGELLTDTDDSQVML